jgi:hypothetical protein
MLKKQNNNLFKLIAKRLINQEIQAQKNFDEIQSEINEHEKSMKERRDSFKFIRNK